MLLSSLVLVEDTEAVFTCLNGVYVVQVERETNETKTPKTYEIITRGNLVQDPMLLQRFIAGKVTTDTYNYENNKELYTLLDWFEQCMVSCHKDVYSAVIMRTKVKINYGVHHIELSRKSENAKLNGVECNLEAVASILQKMVEQRKRVDCILECMLNNITTSKRERPRFKTNLTKHTFKLERQTNLTALAYMVFTDKTNENDRSKLKYLLNNKHGSNENHLKYGLEIVNTGDDRLVCAWRGVYGEEKVLKKHTVRTFEDILQGFKDTVIGVLQKYLQNQVLKSPTVSADKRYVLILREMIKRMQNITTVHYLAYNPTTIQGVRVGLLTVNAIYDVLECGRLQTRSNYVEFYRRVFEEMGSSDGTSKTIGVTPTDKVYTEKSSIQYREIRETVVSMLENPTQHYPNSSINHYYNELITESNSNRM